MSREYWVLAAASILLLAVFSRRDKPRESLFLFLLAQAVTWPATLFLAYTGEYESPVRLFPKATDGNIIMAFVFIPAVIVAYYWHYPRGKGRSLQIAYTLATAGFSTLVHVAVQKYTDLVVYITLTGYKVWVIGIVTNYILRIYADWYFSQLAKARQGNPR